MSKVVAAVEFTFENLDYVKIPARYFSMFGMENLHTDIGFFGTNTLLRSQSMDCLRFCLKRSADRDYKTFDQDMYGLEDPEWGLFQRLTVRRDITQVRLHYADGLQDDYLVPWLDLDEMHEYDSQYQHAERLEDGSLTVVISKRAEDAILPR